MGKRKQGILSSLLLSCTYVHDGRSGPWPRRTAYVRVYSCTAHPAGLVRVPQESEVHRRIWILMARRRTIRACAYDGKSSGTLCRVNKVCICYFLPLSTYHENKDPIDLPDAVLHDKHWQQADPITINRGRRARTDWRLLCFT